MRERGRDFSRSHQAEPGREADHKAVRVDLGPIRKVVLEGLPEPIHFRDVARLNRLEQSLRLLFADVQFGCGAKRRTGSDNHQSDERESQWHGVPLARMKQGIGIRTSSYGIDCKRVATARKLLSDKNKTRVARR